MLMRLLAPGEVDARVRDDLVEVLCACVADGASVGFLHPLEIGAAGRWWDGALADPDRLVWVALQDGLVLGTVALALATLPNAAHRAEVSKLLVHPSARRRGIASLLLRTVEQEALARGRTTLVLDTETGSPAEGLYAGLGWQRVGSIADYALCPDGRMSGTTFMCRHLRT